jgi:indole-3-glycerol phosphate synthase
LGDLKSLEVDLINYSKMNILMKEAKIVESGIKKNSHFLPLSMEDVTQYDTLSS